MQVPIYKQKQWYFILLQERPVTGTKNHWMEPSLFLHRCDLLLENRYDLCVCDFYSRWSHGGDYSFFIFIFIYGFFFIYVGNCEISYKWFVIFVVHLRVWHFYWFCIGQIVSECICSVNHIAKTHSLSFSVSFFSF